MCVWFLVGKRQEVALQEVVRALLCPAVVQYTVLWGYYTRPPVVVVAISSAVAVLVVLLFAFVV